MQTLIKWAALALVALAALVIAHDPSFWMRRLGVTIPGTATTFEALDEPRETVPGGNQPPAPRESPTSESLDPQALEAAADYAGAHQSKALIVSRHGYIVFEKYWGGTDFDTPLDAGPLARVLTALAAGAAVSDRSIGWPDEPIGNFIAEWQNDARGTITVRNLLQMTSGLAPGGGDRDVFGNDIIAQYLRRPLAARPGDRWLDQSADPELLGHVIELATKQRYSQYLSQVIWRRIGAADASVWLDHAGGAAHVDRGFRAHQGDWIRVGELLLTNGRYQGDEVLVPRWIPQMLLASKTNSNYGAYIGLGAHAASGMTPYAARDVFVVQGSGNRLWVIPSLQLVILRTGDFPSGARGTAATAGVSDAGASGASASDWDDGRIPNLIVRGARDFVSPTALPAADLRQLVPNH